MNTRRHQQPLHANTAPAEKHRPPSTTTQTWDQYHHNAHAAFPPKTSHLSKTHGDPCQHADTDTAGDRP